MRALLPGSWQVSAVHSRSVVAAELNISAPVCCDDGCAGKLAAAVQFRRESQPRIALKLHLLMSVPALLIGSAALCFSGIVHAAPRSDSEAANLSMPVISGANGCDDCALLDGNLASSPQIEEAGEFSEDFSGDSSEAGDPDVPSEDSPGDSGDSGDSGE
jgi:hypothetical protein